MASVPVAVPAAVATDMKLPTELGQTAEESAPATECHARGRIAAAVGITPASAAVLSVAGGADLADLDSILEAAGIVDLPAPRWSSNGE